MYKRILVATDGSELSHKAVDHAIGLAALCQAELIAVTVVPHYPRSYFDGSLPLTNDEVERVEKHWSEGGHKILETVQTAAKAQGVTLSDVVVKSDLVADALIETAKTQKADLIVMGAHSHTTVGEILLGSTAHRVAQNAAAPVMLVRLSEPDGPAP